MLLSPINGSSFKASFPATGQDDASKQSPDGVHHRFLAEGGDSADSIEDAEQEQEETSSL